MHLRIRNEFGAAWGLDRVSSAFFCIMLSNLLLMARTFWTFRWEGDAQGLTSPDERDVRESVICESLC